MNGAGVDVHRLGERRRFRVLNAACLGCSCFDPQVLRTDKGVEVPTCLTRARSTCPDHDQRGFSQAAELRLRDIEGWRDD